MSQQHTTPLDRRSGRDGRNRGKRRAPSCDFASQSSSLRSSGDLTASPQVHPALTRPDACGAGASRDGHSLRLHSPAADPSRVHLFNRFSRDCQCRAEGNHIIPDRTRKAQDTAIKLLSNGLCHYRTPPKNARRAQARSGRFRAYTPRRRAFRAA